MEEEDGDCTKEAWAKIQENTFTRWVNHQIRSDQPLVSSLKTRDVKSERLWKTSQELRMLSSVTLREDLVSQKCIFF